MLEPWATLAFRHGKRGEIIRYVCPGCGLRMWGRPRLFVTCRDCDEPLEESGPMNSTQLPLPLSLPSLTKESDDAQDKTCTY